MKYLFIFIALIFSNVYAQEAEQPSEEAPPTGIPVIFLSNIATQFTWSPKSPDSIVVEADEGYKISVNITDCNIDGDHGEYASITTDKSTNRALIFTYGVKNKPSYIYNTNRLFGDFFGTNASNFTAIFIRIGEELTTTTTEIPTTTISLPAPDANVSSTLQVYLEGKRMTEPDDNILQVLKDSIAGMAVEYCYNENFALNGSVTSNNVLIKRLLHCPPNWPDADICRDFTFAVPVNLREDVESLWTGYQLTTEHLEIMWSRYADSYLPDGITIYSSPDSDSLRWGIVIASAIIVVFIVAMTVVRYIGAKVSKKMRRREASDRASIISTSDRNSQTSLPPHFLQEIPPLFENVYPMYNPDNGAPYMEPSYTNPIEYDEYQDLDTGINNPSEEIDDIESRA